MGKIALTHISTLRKKYFAAKAVKWYLYPEKEYENQMLYVYETFEVSQTPLGVV